MKKPQELTAWEFKDKKAIPDGYDWSEIPESTTDNFNTLLEHYNNLVECFNAMAEYTGFSASVKYED